MLQAETLPQSMVDVKTIVLKPRLDQGDIRSMGEKVKLQLFSKYGFKPKPEDIKLLASEEDFEPYFFIGGKYVLDYCKKHVIEAEVDKKTTRLFVAGQEFNSKESDPKTRRRVVEMTGEEHVHYEKQGYYILDRMNREIPPEKLPLSPFVVKEKDSELNYLFKRMHISDEKQIDFLKTKIAQRPADVAEIMKEIFDITDRTIAYYPMYLLTFENTKKRKEATITIDGITGETVLNGKRNLAVNTILTSREALESQNAEPVVCQEAQTEAPEPSLDVVPPVVRNEVKVPPKKNQITEYRLTQPVVCREDQAATIHESGWTISKDEDEAILKENQVTLTQTARPEVCGKVQDELAMEVVHPEAKNNVEISQKEDEIPESKHLEPVAEAVPSAIEHCLENSSKDEHTAQTTQPEETTPPEQEQTEPKYIIPPGQIDETLNGSKEVATVESIQPEDNEHTILGFSAIIHGEIVEIDDNLATVEGDVEIPSGTNINKDLVVKGSLKIGDNCRGRGKLKAFKDITIGADTIIDGDIISGGSVFVGSRSLITGSVEAAGTFEIEENAVIETDCPQTPSSE